MPPRISSAEPKLDPSYVGFFQRFNEQQYFEAHEVLEELWRATAHLEKHRPTCECLDVNSVVDLLRDVQRGRNLLAEGQPPHLELRRT